MGHSIIPASSATGDAYHGILAGFLGERGLSDWLLHSRMSSGRINKIIDSSLTMTIYGASNTILQIKGTVFIGGYLCTIDPEELYTLPITPSQVVTYWVYIELEESEGFATAFSIKHATSFDSFPSSNKFFLGRVVVNESEITAIIGGDVATDYFIYTGFGSGEVGRNVRLYTTPTLIAVTGVDPEKKIFSIGSLYGYGFCVYQPVNPPPWIYYVWSSSEAVIPAIRGFGFYIRSSEDGLRDLDASYCDFQALSIG